MDCEKLGQLILQLRKEKGLTQEQFAEKLGVSNRSVSRWENGTNMPDFDVVIEIVKHFDITVDEFLNGERKKHSTEHKETETIQKISDYNRIEKQKIQKRIHFLFVMAILAFIFYGIIDFSELQEAEIYRDLATYAMGIIFGVLLVGALYTSRHFHKIKAFKQHMIKKEAIMKEEYPKAYKRKRTALTVLSIMLFISGIAFLAAALFFNHSTGFSAGTCVLCASAIIIIRLRQI